MNRLQAYLVRMIIFVAIVVALAAVLAVSVSAAFLANAGLNAFILGVLVLGIVYIFRQVILLRIDVAWIENFRESEEGIEQHRPPRLLQPMATMVADRRTRMSLSALSMRSLLDGIGARLDESRDISRYLIGLLIFLGLLGTFWGLLQTVTSVGNVIGSLSVGDADIAGVFDRLKSGLEQPLSGMGTAFSSSLFGLAGSLVLGFLDLQAGQAQNRFYNDLEDWLSRFTRLSSGAGIVEGEGSVPSYVNALLEKTADSLDELQRTLARGEERRQTADANMLALTQKIATLTDQMHTEQELMTKLAENQLSMKRLLDRLGEAREAPLLDEASRTHLRNLDVYMSRLLEETTTGRNQLISELRGEIKLLARTLAARPPGERG
jgi:hypothetical protein